jgi:rubrerythrin
VHVDELKSDAEDALKEVERLGEAGIGRFDRTLFKPVRWEETVNAKKAHICDRCGYEMHEKNCKVTCLNCGNRFDCSDLNIYFD